MHIAILGATSQIAKDLILSLARHTDHDLVLYARRTAAVKQWLVSFQLHGRYSVNDISAFGTQHHFDVILNFVGVGNPAQAIAMGYSIFDVTQQYDALVLAYLSKYQSCRYFFLSSGAAYGGNFSEPVNEKSVARIAINNLSSQDWYGVAKLYAECRHRGLSDLSIVDIRVFSYFSSTQDIAANFLISDVVRAIRSSEVLKTSPVNIVRDYLGAEDFYQLVDCLLSASPTNAVVDCYTQAPIDKLNLLEELKNSFGLKYEITGKKEIGVNATGQKLNYYSTNYKAACFGYKPQWNCLESVLNTTNKILEAFE